MASALASAPSTNVVAPANRLKGKVALVTGGTRGIGLAVARAYAREGATVMIAARNSAELKLAVEMVKAEGGNVTGLKVDLNSAAACEQLYLGALRAHGKISVLVNNAAILGPRKSIVDSDVRDWADVMRTNLDVVYWLTKYALGTMIPANEGAIINVVSGVATKGQANWGAYSVSKAAVVNLTEVVAEEVSRYGVRVNCVNPGATRTMMRAEAFPTEDPAKLPKPEDIVNPFIYLASDASKGLTGQTLESSEWIGREF